MCANERKPLPLLMTHPDANEKKSHAENKRNPLLGQSIFLSAPETSSTLLMVSVKGQPAGVCI